MWGNALGWSLSAAWVVCVMAGLALVNNTIDATSARTDFSRDSDNAAAIELPVPPQVVVPGMIQGTEGGPIYRRAIEQYLQDRHTYDTFARAGRQRDIADVPAIRTLIEATKCASADLFASRPSEIVNYAGEKPELEGLRVLGACARRAGQLIEKQRPAEALELYEAAFALGCKLYNERLTWAELDAGLTLMAEGSALIGKFADAAGDRARAEACRRFDEARKRYVNERIAPVLRVIASADQATLERHAGDVFYFARNAGERMWRVEAIFKLGRYRFNAGRVGDQRSAPRVLRDLSDDADPVIRTAAAAARDLTIEQYRMLR